MLGIDLEAQSYIERMQRELERVDISSVERWSDAVYRAWKQRQTVFVIGNGGSATTASHMMEDLAKGIVPPDRLADADFPRLKVISLTDNAGWLTAVGNDISFDQVFVQQLMNWSRAGDLLIALSGSGNSPNILAAVDWCRAHEVSVFGLSGFDGGELKSRQDDGVHVDVADMGLVQSIHLTLFHWVLDDVYARVNDLGRYCK